MSMDQYGNREPDFRSTKDEVKAYVQKRQQQTFDTWNKMLAPKK